MSSGLPDLPSMLPLAALKTIDQICARFEQDWLAGRNPCIQDYLQDVAEGERPHLFRELLQAETELQAKSRPLVQTALHATTAEARPVIVETLIGSSEKGRSTDHAAIARPTTTSPHRQIGRYRVVKVLGRGGMGVVYLAEHQGLQRQVAIKMLRAGEHGSVDQLARFRIEAEAVARLQHPNVVGIHSIGKHKGAPFLVLEYVAGGSLQARLNGHPQPPRQAALLLSKLVRAVQAAHEKGVIHRDLKPANILLVEDGPTPLPLGQYTPKITDFGLAKRFDRTDLTETGQILGTPDYMAPEQAKGQVREIGPGTDIYALGSILYTLLTGQPPFRGVTVVATLDLVCNRVPVPPRQLQLDCPKDLETVCLKCLEKDPARRYPSARALAEDLERFLAGQPVHARPVGPCGRGLRWTKRNPLAAGLLSAVLLVSMLGTLVATRLAFLAGDRARQAESSAERATVEQQRAHRSAEAEAQARQRAEWLAYANQVCLAQREFERKMVPKAQMILDQCRSDFRHWEHAYLKGIGPESSRVVNLHSSPVTALAFSPDGRWFASASQGLSVKLLDVQTGKSFTLAELRGPILALTFTSSANRLAAVTENGTLVRWEVASGRQLHAFETSGGPIRQATFSRDGEKVAVVGRDTATRVWDAQGRSLLALDGPRPESSAVAFSADSTLLAVAGTGGIEVWDLTSGQRKHTLGRSEAIDRLAFSRDGSRLAMAAGKQFSVWELAREAPLFVCSEHADPISSVIFSADGKRVFTGSADRTIKVWEATRGQCLLTLEGHVATVTDLGMSEDGTHLVSGDRTGRAIVWSADRGQRQSPARPSDSPAERQ